QDNLRLAGDFLGRAGVRSRVTYHREDAAAALRRVGGSWDIVYNDIDKDSYPATIDLAYDAVLFGYKIVAARTTILKGRIAVRFGSGASYLTCSPDDGLSPNSGRKADVVEFLKRANSGHQPAIRSPRRRGRAATVAR